MSARWVRPLALGGLALLIAAPAFAEGRLPAFRRLRQEAVAATRAGDADLARARLSEALAIMPTHPGVLLSLARLTAATDPASALALVDRYARLGLTFDVAGDKALAFLTARPDFAPVAQRLATNLRPIGAVTPVIDLAGAPLAEGVAYDARRRRLLISQVHDRKIVALAADGTLSDFTPPAEDLWSVFGVAADVQRRTLWALTSATDQTRDLKPNAKGAGALLKIDLDTGHVLTRYPVPSDGVRRQLGDLTVAADGTVYAANSQGGEIWRLKPGASALDLMTTSNEIGSAQGLAVFADGKALIVADYSSGLHRIDLADGTITAVEAPADLSLLGSDGVIADGDNLIIIQNGVSPQRLLRLRLSPDGRRITRAALLAANLPELDEPTGGVMRGREFVFVARSQWSDFGDDGKPRDGLGSARISALRASP